MGDCIHYMLLQFINLFVCWTFKEKYSSSVDAVYFHTCVIC